jgi:hypothetical protein
MISRHLRRYTLLLWAGLAALLPLHMANGAGSAGGTGGRSRSGKLLLQAQATLPRSPSPPPQEDPAPPAEKAPIGGGESVAVFEYRNDVKQLSDLPERLTQTLSRNTSLFVIDPADARRRLGPSVDAEVARCDGETRCLSLVGRKLGAGEVLLLAVSQLGDVVMALQRIEVSGQRVLARYADSIVSGQAVDEARILGWLQQLYPPQTFKRYGQIRVTTDVSGAQVYVNAKARGKTPLPTPLQVLAPGNYRLLVEKDKFLPFQASISVMPDTLVEVSAPLQREGKEVPAYRRWYMWFGLGAGVAAVVATGVAIRLATDKPPPDMSMVPGTITFK